MDSDQASNLKASNGKWHVSPNWNEGFMNKIILVGFQEPLPVIERPKSFQNDGHIKSEIIDLFQSMEWMHLSIVDANSMFGIVCESARPGIWIELTILKRDFYLLLPK